MLKRTIVLLFLFSVVFAARANGQDYPKAEGFLGYTYIRYSSRFFESGSTQDLHINLNGGSGSITFSPYRSIGITAEIGGSTFSHVNVSDVPGSINAKSTVITYLFGPHFAIRRSSRFTPFVHFLFGGAHRGEITGSGAGICPGSGSCTLDSSKSTFALAMGGGVDVNVNKHIAIRLVQLDDLITRFSDTDGPRTTQNNIRYSGGIVVH